MTDIEYYLKLHDAISMTVEVAWKARVGRTHFKAPYNFHERIDIRVISHQIKIYTMDNKGQVQSIEYPKYSEGR